MNLDLTILTIFRNGMDDLQEIHTLSSNLKSITKLTIIQYLFTKDATNQEILEDIGSYLNIKYRSAIYGALADLQRVGIVDKYYDNKENKIKYRVVVKMIKIDLENMKLEYIR